MIENIVAEFRKIQIQHNLPSGDFPNVERFRQKLQNGGFNFSDFPKIKDKLINKVLEALEVDIPQLMQTIPGMQSNQGNNAANPFEVNATPQIGTMMDDDKMRYGQLFNQLTAGNPAARSS